MADYPTIRGLRVKYLSADPSTATEGEVWYNSTSGTLKTSLLMGAWSSGGTLPTATVAAATLGTQTAALITSGYGYPSNPSGIPQTQIYNGSGWTAGAVLTDPRVYFAGAGTTGAGVVFGGIDQSPPYRDATCELYNGTTWSESGDLASGRSAMGMAKNSPSVNCPFQGVDQRMNLDYIILGIDITGVPYSFPF